MCDQSNSDGHCVQEVSECYLSCDVKKCKEKRSEKRKMEGKMRGGVMVEERWRSDGGGVMEE